MRTELLILLLSIGAGFIIGTIIVLAEIFFHISPKKKYPTIRDYTIKKTDSIEEKIARRKKYGIL